MGEILVLTQEQLDALAKRPPDKVQQVVALLSDDPTLSLIVSPYFTLSEAIDL